MNNLIEEYKQICAAFFGGERVTNIIPWGEGHINSTFKVCLGVEEYILQRINTTVFPSPDDVMKNIYHVTEHLMSKGCETLNIIPTVDGNLYLRHHTGCYRMYRFIENTITYQSCPDKETLYYAGKAFGEFQNELADFDASNLKEIIPGFHNTPKRYETFKRVVETDCCGRLEGCRSEVDFVIKRGNTYGHIVDALEDGSVPIRTTHNDTKLNNILMDCDTKKARAIIDLDTVMPGSMLYDYGDAIRFGTSTAAEDEKDLEKVHFDIEAYETYTNGYLDGLKNNIVLKEVELMPYSAYLMTMECGMRFLTDYLEGDKYFAIHYPEHNLVRCKTQFKLAYEMEQQMKAMEIICRMAIKR